MNEPRFPSPKSPEAGPERIHTEEEVLALMLPHTKDGLDVEGLKAKIQRRLSDEKGLYLLEVIIEVSDPGEIEQYRYMRAGDHGNQNASAESRIDVVYYVDGTPCGSNQIAKFDTTSGKWK